MDEIITSAEFLAHLIVADEQIHSEEVFFLEAFFLENHIEPNDPRLKSIFDILGDVDDKKPLEHVLHKVQQLSSEHQENLIRYAVTLLTADGHADQAETTLMRALARQLNWPADKIEELIDNSLDAVHQEKQSQRELGRDFSKFDYFKLKLKMVFSSREKREETAREFRRLILTGPEYGVAIRQAAQTAREDCDFAQQQLTELEAETRKKILQIEGFIQARRKSQEDIELRQSIDEFIQFLKKDAIADLKKNSQVLNSKRRTVENFSVAFLGRTKAGKSTLHYLMTGEGENFIGKGLERTTRYNRVYEWDHVRIIDTPGIGAAEEGGRQDEEIAKSILDEADVICYVVTSDNIQDAEFKFLELIRARNKPVVILLNVKINIKSPPPQFKRFLEDPLYWRNRTDDQNIQGHINRIKHCSRPFYDERFLTIIPVQLLAARMSKDPRYQEVSKKLYDGSCLDDFFDYLRECILKSGSIRKSQTILDGVTAYLDASIKDVKKYAESCTSAKNSLAAKQKELQRQLGDIKQKATTECAKELESLFKQLNAKIAEFAEDNYDLSKSRLESAWERFSSDELRLNERINEVITRVTQDGMTDINDAIEDVVEDASTHLKYEFTARLNALDTFNTRRLVSSFGAVVSTAGSVLLLLASVSNPVGWAIIGVGIVTGLLSGLLKSKEEKKRNAIDKLRNDLQGNIEGMKAKVVQDAQKSVNTQFTQVATATARSFDELIKGFTRAETVAQQYTISLVGAYRAFNERYAQRILDFALSHAGACDTPAMITQIQREFGKNIKIFAPHVPEARITAHVATILQETVQFEKTGTSK
jgi:GTP-binding protein EngB required for normal cell division